MEQMLNFKSVLNAIIFSVVGLVALGISFIVFDRLTPGNLWKEVCEEKNLPLALVASAFTLAMAQIIAAAIHG